MNMYRIFLVDDEEEVRKGIIRKIQWEHLGFTVVGDADGVRPGLCAPIEVVAAVLFGDPKIGRIFGLPAVRPYLSDI